WLDLINLGPGFLRRRGCSREAPKRRGARFQTHTRLFHPAPAFRALTLREALLSLPELMQHTGRPRVLLTFQLGFLLRPGGGFSGSDDARPSIGQLPIGVFIDGFLTGSATRHAGTLTGVYTV